MNRVPLGKVEYNLNNGQVTATAVSWTNDELDNALQGPVLETVLDVEGKNKVLKTLEEAGVDIDGIGNVLLNKIPKDNNWRVGESLAILYLTHHRNCLFPWPSSRDQKTPDASLPGADLVGFQQKDKYIIFAFGEVKTSHENRRPPTVVTGKNGLQEQIHAILSKKKKQEGLIKYLTHHIVENANPDWLSRLKEAWEQYNQKRIAIFGILIRDVTPDIRDLQSSVKELGADWELKTFIEFIAVYLPEKSISLLGAKMANYQ